MAEKHLKKIMDNNASLIFIPSIGYLTQNNKFNDYWVSKKKIPVPYFNNLGIEFIIIAKKSEINDDFNKVIDNFLQLKKDQRLETSKYVFKNYKEFIEFAGEDELDFKVTKKDDVWRHVHPTKIYVQRRQKNNSLYIQIIAECDWNEEDGLQIIYENGNKLSRISVQDGHLTNSDAYALSENEDRIY